MTQSDTADRPSVGSGFTFGARPTVGAAAAVKDVAEDMSALVRAEIELAKAELSEGIKANGIGAGLLVGAAVMMWFAVQGLLIAAGFALGLVVPGWAAALIVTLILLIIGAVLAWLGSRKLGTPVSIDQTKANVQEDAEWFKTHLRGR
jgi:uncharacterized membrane protein YqjE